MKHKMALPRIQDFDDPEYDPFTASARLANTDQATDIYPELKRLRQIATVQEMDLRAHFGTATDLTAQESRQFAVFGYNEVCQILFDSENWSNKAYEVSLGIAFGDSITIMDPPRHRDFRKIFQKAFTPTMIANYGKTTIPEAVNSSIERLVGRGEADLASEFAFRFPFDFINELLQLPHQDRATFQKLAFGQTTTRYDLVHSREAGQKLRTYLYELLEDRRSNPLGDGDFISTIALAEIDGERLPDEVIVSFLRQLMNAGGDTSFHGFSSALTVMMTRPGLLDMVRNDRTLIDAALDECLRLEAPTNMLDRTPSREITVAGVTMLPGDRVNIILGAANRDETIFEDPDTFSLARKQKRHTSFGYGPHICIGQHLAKLEMRIALNTLLDRLPNLRLDPAYPAPVVAGIGLRGPKSVRVLFDT